MRILTLLILAGGLAPAMARGADENRPLIVFQISEARLNQALNEPIEQESDVDYFMLDTRVVGAATTRGVPSLNLIENGEGASFKVVFQGATVSRTAGRHTPVVVYSRSQTDFTAEKLIDLEQLGGEVQAQPTTVRANTQTQTENITTSRRGPIGRLVLRRAWKAVEEKRVEANAIGQKHAEKRIVEAFDAALDARLARLEKQMAMRVFVAAILPANSAPAYRSVTQGSYLNIAVFSRQPDEKKVAVELPKLPLEEQPIHVWVHQSVVGKNIDSALGSLGALRHLVTFPAVGIVPTPNSSQRGPKWTVVDEWFVIQLTGLDK